MAYIFTIILLSKLMPNLFKIFFVLPGTKNLCTVFRDENVECVTFQQPLSKSATFSLYDSPSCVLASLWVKSRAEKAIVAQMEKWSHMLSISHHITLMIP